MDDRLGVEILLLLGANPNTKGAATGQTALHRAVEVMARDTDGDDIVDQLISAGAAFQTPEERADRAVKHTNARAAGCAGPPYGRSPNKMALITSGCGTMRSRSIKWP